jgi:hypothetical protein
MASVVSFPIRRRPAILELTCGETDLTSINVSGPCATSDAGPPYLLAGGVGSAVSDERPLGTASSVYVTSPTPGVCHVQLVFATGFTFTTDVTFVSGTASACGTTVQYVGPSPVVFQVNNPAATCLDAGADAPAYDGTVNVGDASVGAAADIVDGATDSPDAPTVGVEAGDAGPDGSDAD